jgi:nitrite reductase/ring-hydroxylating ferredoxin subunit
MAEGARVICASAELAEHGEGIRFAVAREARMLPAFAARFYWKVHAYVDEYRHQTSELDWQPGEFFGAGKLYFACATHGEMYAPNTGACVAGPCCGARLAAVAVEEHKGRILCIGD